MQFKEMKVSEVILDPFRSYQEEWALITAGEPENFNTMTISWGSFGELWGRHTVTVYVRHSRYTYEYMEREDRFSLTFYARDYREILSRLGTKSGRDIDKMGDSGLTPCAMDGTVAFEEAKLVIVCRKLYRHDFIPEEFTDMSLHDGVYGGRDYHRAYVGEIEKIYIKE